MQRPAKPSTSVRFRPSPTALIWLGVALPTAALAVALWLQHARGMAPCPLCVLQRLAFLLMLVAALAALHPRWRKPALVVMALAALGNLGLAARHLWEIAYPSMACGIDPMESWINHSAPAQWLPWLLQADGLCTSKPRFWGVVIPWWSALIAVTEAALSWAALKRR